MWVVKWMEASLVLHPRRIDGRWFQTHDTENQWLGRPAHLSCMLDAPSIPAMALIDHAPRRLLIPDPVVGLPFCRLILPPISLLDEDLCSALALFQQGRLKMRRKKDGCATVMDAGRQHALADMAREIKWVST